MPRSPESATQSCAITSVLDKVFETGRKTADGFKKNMKIKFDEFLPKWNYVAVPLGGT